MASAVGAVNANVILDVGKHLTWAHLESQTITPRKEDHIRDLAVAEVIVLVVAEVIVLVVAEVIVLAEEEIAVRIPIEVEDTIPTDQALSLRS